MVKVVPSITESRIRYNDVYSTKLSLRSFEECKELVPITSISLLEQRTIDWFRWFLKVAYEDSNSCFRKVMNDALTNPATAAGYDGGSAMEFVAFDIKVSTIL